MGLCGQTQRQRLNCKSRGLLDGCVCSVRLDKLRPGEKATVACLACDREQAKIVLNYVRSYFDLVPPLAQMVVRRSADGLELSNDVTIEVGTNSFRSVRGRAFLLTILDEVAFYRDENSARPDVSRLDYDSPEARGASVQVG